MESQWGFKLHTNATNPRFSLRFLPRKYMSDLYLMYEHTLRFQTLLALLHSMLLLLCRERTFIHQHASVNVSLRGFPLLFKTWLPMTSLSWLTWRWTSHWSQQSHAYMYVTTAEATDWLTWTGCDRWGIGGRHRTSGSGGGIAAIGDR